MEEYRPNSHRSKVYVDPKDVSVLKKPTPGKVKLRKKNEVRKLADVFIAGDMQNVKEQILDEVIVPAVRNIISDIVTNGIEMILWGESGHTKRDNGSRTSYSRFYEKNEKRVGRPSEYARRGVDCDDFEFDYQRDAKELLDCMNEHIRNYGTVRVADAYEFLEKTPPYTSYNYGWSDLRNAKVVPIRNGWLLKLPKALPIDNLK